MGGSDEGPAISPDVGVEGWEGWMTENTKEGYVRRFAKPPYRWVTVPIEHFD